MPPQRYAISILHRPTRFRRLFRRGAVPAMIPDNQATLIPDGGEFFSALINEINRAEKLLLLEFYIIRSDEAGLLFAEALAAAVSRGVRVLLLYDYIGSFDTPGDYFRRIRQSGVLCHPFNPPAFRRGVGWLDQRDHRKMAVRDGSRALVGGVNIGNEYSGHGVVGKWRDAGVIIQGPAVTELCQLFRETWEHDGDTFPLDSFRQGDLPAQGDAEVGIIGGTPHRLRSAIRRTFRLAIAGASHRVSVMTPYFLPGPRLVRSMLRASRRGVKVRIILPEVSDVPLVRLLSRAFFHPLLANGIEIYERQHQLLHAKVMLVDDHWSVFGSANLDHRSFLRNYELGAIIDSPDFGRQVGEMFDHDLELSRRITLDEHRRRGWIARLLEFAFSPIARFL
jgi:cardiolipin synthase A/B